MGLIISASSTFSGGVSFDRSTTTNATSTSFFATLGRFTTAIADALTATVATIANLTSTTIVATNATTTRLDALDYVAIGRTATTTIRGDGVASTIPFASSTAISSSYASSTNGFFGNLSIGSLSGFLKATAGSIATALIDLASNVTGILGVGNGGTGWSNVASGALVLGNGTGSLATTTAGTNGQVLALVGGVPSWIATTTLANISGTLGVASGGTGLSSYTLGDILYASGTGTLAGTTTANLKATLALNNVENTALSTWAGSSNLTTLGTITSGTWNGTTIAIANGGTGSTTAPVGHLLYGGSTAYQSVATSSASCSSGILCSSFTVVGSVSPSITFSAP
ncbi:MAG: hypothetical protein Q7S02_00615, partial [bacterium]|nr:hypothetical protein [bacterium]